VVTLLTPFLVAPGQVWLLALEATSSAMLLLIAALHTGRLLRWLRNPPSPALNAGWSTEVQATMATEQTALGGRLISSSKELDAGSGRFLPLK
jgi:hypothetical protein